MEKKQRFSFNFIKWVGPLLVFTFANPVYSQHSTKEVIYRNGVLVQKESAENSTPLIGQGALPKSRSFSPPTRGSALKIYGDYYSLSHAPAEKMGENTELTYFRDKKENRMYARFTTKERDRVVVQEFPLATREELRLSNPSRVFQTIQRIKKWTKDKVPFTKELGVRFARDSLGFYAAGNIVQGTLYGLDPFVRNASIQSVLNIAKDIPLLGGFNSFVSEVIKMDRLTDFKSYSNPAFFETEWEHVTTLEGSVHFATFIGSNMIFGDYLRNWHAKSVAPQIAKGTGALLGGYGTQAATNLSAALIGNYGSMAAASLAASIVSEVGAMIVHCSLSNIAEMDPNSAEDMETLQKCDSAFDDFTSGKMSLRWIYTTGFSLIPAAMASAITGKTLGLAKRTLGKVFNLFRGGTFDEDQEKKPSSEKTKKTIRMRWSMVKTSMGRLALEVVNPLGKINKLTRIPTARELKNFMMGVVKQTPHLFLFLGWTAILEPYLANASSNFHAEYVDDTENKIKKGIDISKSYGWDSEGYSRGIKTGQSKRTNRKKRKTLRNEGHASEDFLNQLSDYEKYQKQWRDFLLQDAMIASSNWLGYVSSVLNGYDGSREFYRNLLVFLRKRKTNPKKYKMPNTETPFLDLIPKITVLKPTSSQGTDSVEAGLVKFDEPILYCPEAKGPLICKAQKHKELYEYVVRPLAASKGISIEEAFSRIYETYKDIKSENIKKRNDVYASVSPEATVVKSRYINRKQKITEAYRVLYHSMKLFPPYSFLQNYNLAYRKKMIRLAQLFNPKHLDARSWDQGVLELMLLVREDEKVLSFCDEGYLNGGTCGFLRAYQVLGTPKFPEEEFLYSQNKLLVEKKNMYEFDQKSFSFQTLGLADSFLAHALCGVNIEGSSWSGFLSPLKLASGNPVIVDRIGLNTRFRPPRLVDELPSGICNRVRARGESYDKYNNYRSMLSKKSHIFQEDIHENRRKGARMHFWSWRLESSKYHDLDWASKKLNKKGELRSFNNVFDVIEAHLDPMLRLESQEKLLTTPVKDEEDRIEFLKEIFDTWYSKYVGVYYQKFIHKAKADYKKVLESSIKPALYGEKNFKTGNLWPDVIDEKEFKAKQWKRNTITGVFPSLRLQIQFLIRDVIMRSIDFAPKVKAESAKGGVKISKEDVLKSITKWQSLFNLSLKELATYGDLEEDRAGSVVKPFFAMRVLGEIYRILGLEVEYLESVKSWDKFKKEIKKYQLQSNSQYESSKSDSEKAKLESSLGDYEMQASLIQHLESKILDPRVQELNSLNINISNPQKQIIVKAIDMVKAIVVEVKGYAEFVHRLELSVIDSDK